jgi:hypothetical protein
MNKIICGIILLIANVGFADEAQDLLVASDLARSGVSEGTSWQVRLQSWENGKESDRSFDVKVKQNDALVEAVAPAKFKGEVYLFNDRTMWFFKTGLKKPVAISARQKLSGQTANGDIASTNYSRDYNPTIERSEKVGNDMCKVLLLKAKNDKVTYDQIRYWVSEKSKQAVKAEFMTLQGTPFKVATFEYKNILSIGGKRLPFVSRMTLTDVKFQQNRSVMEYSNPHPQNHAAAIFNINNLSR